MRNTGNNGNNRETSSDDEIPLANYVKKKKVIKRRNVDKNTNESTQVSATPRPFESNSVENIDTYKSGSKKDNSVEQGIENKVLSSASRASLIEKLMSQNEKFNADIISLLK